MERLLLRVSETADILGIGKSTAYELVATGELPSLKIGKAIRVSVADLKIWIQQRRAKTEGLSK
jgi:excisionase family DNA binding protein